MHIHGSHPLCESQEGGSEPKWKEAILEPFFLSFEMDLKNRKKNIKNARFYNLIHFINFLTFLISIEMEEKKLVYADTDMKLFSLGRDVIHVASEQKVKLDAVKESCYWKVQGHKCASGVPNQPVGRKQIRQGALNRLSHILFYDALAISLESGIIQVSPTQAIDITCVILRTNLGNFEVWSEPVYHKPEIFALWLQKFSQNETLGSLYLDDPNDWYKSVCSKSRKEIMSAAVSAALHMYQQSYLTPIPAPVIKFKDVEFLDIQQPLMKQSRDLTLSIRRLADRLLFDTVLVLDARGFLLAGEFAHENYPIVMVRKAGKLPGDFHQVEYQKEYGDQDIFCISKNAIAPGSRVLIIDDVIATGGSLKAAESLVHMCHATVVSFLAVYAVFENDQLMAKELGSRLRYLCSSKNCEPKPAPSLPTPRYTHDLNKIFIVPPSMSACVGIEYQRMPISWNKFRHSSNIWFNGQSLKGKEVFVLLDPSNAREMMDVIQLLSILYRKDPAKVSIIAPFLEVSTQDRVEYKEDKHEESLALVDTLGKMIGKQTMYTFDLHCEQSRFAFHDLRDISIIEALWKKYKSENPEVIPVFPDDGACKRFGKKLKIEDPVVFRKKRDGEKRIMATDDEIVKNGHFVIIDDLIRSGGTMNTAANYLLNHGALKVDCLFAHSQFEPAAAKNMQVFHDIWTSSTCSRFVPPEWVKIDFLEVLFQNL